jgi:hypothetical protein
MLDIEKFLIALRSNKDLDGKLKPICLADTVQEEIKIIQAAVENSRREWVELTDEEIITHFQTNVDIGSLLSFVDGARYAEAKLKEKNHG